MTDIKTIQDVIEKKHTATTRFLQRFVQEESSKGNEAKAQAIVIEKCRELGLELDIWDIDLETFQFSGVKPESLVGNPNVVGILKGTGQGRSLLLHTHVDVIPHGHVDDWSFPPYSGKLLNGKLYGRGASNMKAGTTAVLLAIEILKELNIDLKGDVIFQSVIDGESGGLGTKAALEKGYLADGAIIPKPSNMKFFHNQKGSSSFRLSVKGRATHGGTNFQGVNAIDKAYEVIQHLKVFEGRRNKKQEELLNESLFLPVHIGKIDTESISAQVPDSVMLEGHIFMAPYENVASVEEELENCVNRLNSEDEWFQQNPILVSWLDYRNYPYSLDENHPFLETLKKSYQYISKDQFVTGTAPWGTDSSYLAEKGGMPFLVWGPGAIEVAYETNEFVELDKIWLYAEVLVHFIINWCNNSE